MANTLLDEVKLALRITHSSLDSDITSKIAAAKLEMTTNGVDSDLVDTATDPLIVEAIKTFCQYKYTRDDKEMENYWNSWVVQLDKLRKTASYREDSDV